MVTATLVDTKIALGRELISALDEAGVEVDVAFWLLEEEREAWQLILSSRELTDLGPMRAYQAVQDALRSLHTDALDLQDVSVPPTRDATVGALRSLAASGSATVQRMRLNGSVLDGVYSHDAYIYRVR